VNPVVSDEIRENTEKKRPIRAKRRQAPVTIVVLVTLSRIGIEIARVSSVENRKILAAR